MASSLLDLLILLDFHDSHAPSPISSHYTTAARRRQSDVRSPTADVAQTDPLQRLSSCLSRRLFSLKVPASFLSSYDEGGEKLPQVDVFITTADVTKEPPLTTAQTILSVLSVDYPTTKLACYLSDDGSAKLMFDVMAETAGYARWALKQISS